MSTAVRNHLLRGLQADLVGPYDPTAPDPEQLRLPPSRWYLTGFLAPEVQREVEDPTADDEEGGGNDVEDDEAGTQEPMPKVRKVFPASLGMSVLLPAAAARVTVTLRWAEYICSEVEPDPKLDADEKRQTIRIWTRVQREPAPLELTLDEASLRAGVRVPEADGVWLVGALGVVESGVSVAGTLALSLFVVNRRSVPDPKLADENYLFQVEMSLAHEHGFVPRPNRVGEDSEDFDDRTSDLHFRDHFEFAVGHGVAVEVPPTSTFPPRLVRTCWIPRAEVPRVVTHEDAEVELRMDVLAELEAAGVQTMLARLPVAYGEWIASQAGIEVGSAERDDTRAKLLKNADVARKRIERGISRLAADPEVLLAFRLANAAMAQSARQRARKGTEPAPPRWRMFQLAFLLLTLDGIADPSDPHREEVELIFFPTGGGKTEAYLGVIAITLLLRRLRGQARPDAGLGVAVLLRYTLRLLTFDQLARASTLICALERIRQERDDLGDQRLAIGLWVGRTATANRLDEVSRKVTEYKNNRGPTPFPLTKCPWCQTDINPNSMSLWPTPSAPEQVRVSCVDPACPFSGRATKGDGLPVLFVDEQIYLELPAFLLATVDKFAMMPWLGRIGKLFGRATARMGGVMFGPVDGKIPGGATKLPQGLRPPELIVQDELHLISGPLGTMTGLYETAIEELSTWTPAGGKPVRPKIIAATATVRRAQAQIQALFGRRRTNVFPPPGVDAFETWFAKLDRSSPGRLYAGVAAPGRAFKAILLRSYVALLGAAMHEYDAKGPAGQLADGSMTLAGYFNSLRELGGMRRLVDDDVKTRCRQAEQRRPRNALGGHLWARKREITEPVELTSRENTPKITAAKARLELPFAEQAKVDVLLASNMISVGVDIDRLGLMVVAGQPKTSAEYIQASSRVGRQTQWPGLVVTCFNMVRPRDRSHYEHFTAYHDSFYRYVEATSVTPFSSPALSRGLVGVLVSLVRLGALEMTRASAVMELGKHRDFAEKMVEVIARRASEQPGLIHDKDAEVTRVGKLAINVLDAWTRAMDLAREDAAKRIYSPYERSVDKGKPFLHTALDDLTGFDDDERKFVASTSMRDVEESVHVWIDRIALGGRR